MSANRQPRRQRSISFRDYLLTRRYHFGRGSSEGWMFTAQALGDPELLDAASWLELREHLERNGSSAATIRAGQRVWSSYLAHVAKNRSLIPWAPTAAANRLGERQL